MMLFSLAVLFLSGMAAAGACRKLRLPPLVGMILAGIAVGPYGLNLLGDPLLSISADLRKLALILILTRAGLSLDVADLKKVGRPAVLMCFVPASFEVIGMVLLAPPLLGISVLDAAILGAVVGAVSPAVIVPRMLRLMEEGWGCAKGIPQLILAGASVDDVFVLVLFSAFTGFAQSGSLSAASFLKIPLSIALGIGVGLAAGLLTGRILTRLRLGTVQAVLSLLSLSFLLVAAEDSLGLPFSALIAVMCVGLALQKAPGSLARNAACAYGSLWTAGEILLFVLVGATVNVQYAFAAGAKAALLILAVLLFRMLGVLICLAKTPLGRGERLFCMAAYLPKATVQAAIGGIPLAMGLSCGSIVLTVAVLSILITAPVGAFLIDKTYRHLLSKN